MLMSPTDAYHSDWSGDGLKEAERRGVVHIHREGEMRKTKGGKTGEQRTSGFFREGRGR